MGCPLDTTHLNVFDNIAFPLRIAREKDTQLRTGTRAELKRLQRELKITTLYVTHDQTEAMTLGDRIALLKDGSLVQAGTPGEMYEQPKTTFAATFIGSPPMNLIPAQIKEKDSRITLAFGDATVVLPREKAEQAKQIKKQQVLLGIRPEHITLRSEASGQTLSGTVTAIEPLGRESLCYTSAQSVATSLS